MGYLVFWGILLFFLLVAAYLFLLSPIFTLEIDADELHWTYTEDGAKIALYRYPPKGDRCRSTPIFFCHGLGASAFNFASPGFNWARRFAELGWDVWVIDLRGHGKSQSPKRDWIFEDYLVDLDSAIEYILHTTKRESLYWVGHSMGGLLLYAYLTSRGGKCIRAGVTLGSPVFFYPETLRPFWLGLRFSWLMHFLPSIPVRPIIQTTIPFFPLLFYTPCFRMQYNCRNIDPKKLWKISYNALTSIPIPLMRQFEQWARDHVFQSYDGQVDYLERMENIHIPIFVIAAKADKMAHPKNVREGFRRLGGPKEYWELSREEGLSADYGHIDIIFGKRAMEEVLPRVEAWLAQYETVPFSFQREEGS